MRSNPSVRTKSRIPELRSTSHQEPWILLVGGAGRQAVAAELRVPDPARVALERREHGEALCVRAPEVHGAVRGRRREDLRWPHRGAGFDSGCTKLHERTQSQYSEYQYGPASCAQALIHAFTLVVTVSFDSAP